MVGTTGCRAILQIVPPVPPRIRFYADPPLRGETRSLTLFGRGVLARSQIPRPDPAPLQESHFSPLAVSKLTANTTSPRETASFKRALTRLIASTVDQPSRNPNWHSARSGPTWDRCCLRYAASTHSKSLLVSSKSYRNARSPSSWRRTGPASFHIRGIRSSLKQSVNNYLSRGHPRPGPRHGREFRQGSILHPEPPNCPSQLLVREPQFCSSFT